MLIRSSCDLTGHHQEWTNDQDYTDQLKIVNLKNLNNFNQYLTSTYKIDHHSIKSNPFRSFHLPYATKSCLLSFFYIWLLFYSTLISVASSQLANNQNQVQPSHSQSSRTVATKYGIVRGTVITLPNVNLQQVEAFLGIPYASPPVGKLRLMPPVTSAHWQGIKDADHYAPSCPQPTPQSSSSFKNFNQTNQTSENCLYLNIFAPISVHQHAVRLPVMVLIHGGDFETGSGSDYDGSVLSSFGNVITVTLNYRLGLLGFFPTMEGTARGNYGLMDQTAALHWLVENIAEFGGLPNNITVFGSGSGAASIHLLTLSPMARNLFQRVILMSGNALSPAYPASTLNTLRNAKQISAQLQCFQSSNDAHHSANQFKDKDTYKDAFKDTYKENYAKDKAQAGKSGKEHKSSELLECLRKQKLEKLMDLQVKQPQFLFKYSPSMEGVLLPHDLVKVMSDKQSPFLQYDLMIGVNSAPLNEFYSSSSQNNDLLADVNSKTNNSPSNGPMTEERREKIIRTLVRNLYTYHLQEIYMTLSNEYRSLTNTSADIEAKLVELLNDALLIAPSLTTAILHSKSQTKSTFVYNFAGLEQLENDEYYHQKPGTTKSNSFKDNQPRNNSTTLNEELSMIFGQPLVPSMKLLKRGNKRNYSSLEVKLSERLILYWTHFAKTGDPNIQQPTSTIYNHHTQSTSSVNSNIINNNLNSLTNSNKYNLKDANYSLSLNELLTQKNSRTEHWPNFNDYTQLYLNLNLHPTVSDHMRSHQLSFFQNLIPKLNRPIANNMQMNEHHLLEDHHNLATYEGAVRATYEGLMRNIALDLEDQLASKRMLELQLNGERQLNEKQTDEKTKVNNLMKLREKLLKWKFISEQSNIETQQNFEDLIRKLTLRIEGGSNANLLTRSNSTLVIEMDGGQDNGGQESMNNNLQQLNSNSNQPDQLENTEHQKNQDEEEDSNSIQQNLKQVNTPPNNQQPKLNDELSYQSRHNANESYSMIIQDSQYSTYLSVTIIVGSSLLFLNILVFSGVFLNSRNRRNNSINQANNNALLNSTNNDNLHNGNSLYVNNQSNSASLNGQQLKAYQANLPYLPCCEYDTSQQQCNATILTLKRNNSNKTYIAKTSNCGGQLNTLKNSIESDYYLQQQTGNYLEDHLTLNNANHNLNHHNSIQLQQQPNNSTSIYNTINKANDLNGTTNFDQTNDVLLDKQQQNSAKLQQQIDCLTVDGSLENGSNNHSNISSISNNTLNKKIQMTNVADLLPTDHRLMHTHSNQQQLNLNGTDLVNVSCSSAVSSSSAATLITSSPANTFTSTPDYYQAQNSANLHHSTLLNNQIANQNTATISYLNHQQSNDQIQGLYGHQTNQYVQLNYQDAQANLNELDAQQQQQSKLLNTNHCNIISCSIAQCDCASTIYKDAYSNLDKMMESN